MRTLRSVVLVILSLASFGGTREAATAQEVGNKYALIVGIKGYPHFAEGKKLRFADRDAQLIYDYLTGPDGPGIPEPNVELLLNEQATRTGILNAMTKLGLLATSRDYVFVFFAGHGIEDPNTGEAYLMTWDSDPTVPDDNGFEAGDFVERLHSRLNPRALFTFIDACHAGAVAFRRGGRDLVQAFNEAWKEAAEGSEQVSMSILAAQANQESWEDDTLEGGHGVFSWFLVQGMKGGADAAITGNGDQTVTAFELYRFVLDSVPAHVQKRFGARQLPIRSPDFVDALPVGVVAAEEIDLAERARGHFQRAYELGQGENWAGAEAEAREAIRLDPEYSSAHNNLGYYLQRQGDSLGAVQEYEEAIRIDPAYELALDNLASILFYMWDSDGSLSAWNQLLGVNPDRARAYNGIGRVYYRMQDYYSALVQFREALLRDPTESVYSNNAELAQERAIRQAREILDTIPGDSNAKFRLSYLLHEEVFEFEEAYQLHHELASASQSQLNLQANLAESSLTSGRPSEAQRIVRELLANASLTDEYRVSLQIVDAGAAVVLGDWSSLPQKKTALRGTMQNLAQGFQVGWSFRGLKHYLGQQQPLVRQDWLIALIEALEVDDLEGALSVLAGSGLP